MGPEKSWKSPGILCKQESGSPDNWMSCEKTVVFCGDSLGYV